MSPLRSIRKTLRPVRRWASRAQTRLAEIPYLLRRPAIGSPDWLIRSEITYGGLVNAVPRRKVSPMDGRSVLELAAGGMTGGDRMLHHGYADTYARYLAAFLGEKDLVLAEFGILRGTGLAIWCDLFPQARVLGFDIDLGHFEENFADLKRRGAFTRNQPELCEYDQLAESPASLSKLLNGQRLDVVIDDGLHSIDAIVTTWRAVAPYLSSRSVYFIEDYPDLLAACGDEFSGFDCRSFGLMTVVSRGLAVRES